LTTIVLHHHRTFNIVL